MIPFDELLDSEPKVHLITETKVQSQSHHLTRKLVRRFSWKNGGTFLENFPSFRRRHMAANRSEQDTLEHQPSVL